MVCEIAKPWRCNVLPRNAEEARGLVWYNNTICILVYI